LTEEGIDHVEDIITLIFQYINLLKVIIIQLFLSHFRKRSQSL
jgi:secreted Zn-dependent insulinase-like peptidase